MTSKVVGQSINKPSVSILISSYNKSEFIEDCLKTLQNIMSLDSEIVIVDDGSTDGSTDILGSYADEYKNLSVYTQKNAGSASSRNRAIQMATKEVLFFMDMDDEIDEGILKKALESFRHSKCAIATLNYETFPISTIGSTMVKLESPQTIPMASHRNEFYDSMGFWRNLYRRDFVFENKLKFLPTFSQVGGGYFILDDIFWLLHISALDTSIFCFPENYVVYRYRNTDQHTKNSWRKYQNQLLLMPTAFDIFLEELEHCNHPHDMEWLAKKSTEILYTHLLMLDFVGLGQVIVDVYRLFRNHRNFLYPYSKIFTVFVFISRVVLYAGKNTCREILQKSTAGNFLWKSARRLLRGKE